MILGGYNDYKTALAQLTKEYDIYTCLTRYKEAYQKDFPRPQLA